MSKIEKCKKNHLQETIIETPRLLIRKMALSDAADMFAYASRADVTKYLLWEHHESIDVTRAYLEFVSKQYKRGGCYDFAIELKAEHKMIGTVGFVQIDNDNRSAEIGYVVNPDYQNMGIASEAVMAIISYAFGKLSMNRVEARYMQGNDPSRRVMEKCGMEYEGTAREQLFVKGMMRDIGCCAILYEDFCKNK